MNGSKQWSNCGWPKQNAMHNPSSERCGELHQTLTRSSRKPTIWCAEDSDFQYFFHRLKHPNPKWQQSPGNKTSGSHNDHDQYEKTNLEVMISLKYEEACRRLAHHANANLRWRPPLPQSDAGTTWSITIPGTWTIPRWIQLTMIMEFEQYQKVVHTGFRGWRSSSITVKIIPRIRQVYGITITKYYYSCQFTHP